MGDLAGLRQLIPPPDGEAVRCKVCGASAPAFGAVSFHRATGREDPPPGQDEPLVQYQRCADCGLIFTGAMDAWSPADFERHIYNAGYLEFDPHYAGQRAAGYADLFRKFAPARGDIRLLDYGGGNGRLAEELRAAGFDCETYDPFSERFRERPKGRFNLISCIETFEHLPRPLETVADLASFADEQVLVVYTTLVQPPEILAERLRWWYVGPRNGHITFYTPAALTRIWAGLGFDCGSFNAVIHAAMRNPPPFADLLVRRVG